MCFIYNMRVLSEYFVVINSGQHDIEKLCERLKHNQNSVNLEISSHPNLSVLPFYSVLPPEEQAKVFVPAEEGFRRIIIATNIAETSLTLNNIRFVVDSGWVKQKNHHPNRRWSILEQIRVSQVGNRNFDLEL